ncbi:hypothetical protein EGS38_11075 [Neisseria chenwenguii]|nr:hypothetical protein EGS38_11075 [Neisseria chenwenguii]
MLKTGELGGLMVNVDSGYDIGAHKSAPYILTSQQLWLGHIYPVVMNAERWKKLSKSDQAAFTKAAQKVYGTLGDTLDKSYDDMLLKLIKDGAVVRMPNGQEVTKFAQAANYQNQQNQWAAKQEAEGVKNVQSVLQKLRNLMAKYGY